MSTTSPEILVVLDHARQRGLRAQIEDQLKDAIRSGRLAPGVALPSSRALAADLGITRGVVVAAYDQLMAEGYVTSRHGSGTVVSAAVHSAAARPSTPTQVRQALIDFRPGLPDLDLFPRAAWLRATREAMHTLPRDDLGYIDSRGLHHAREAIVGYLARVRGVCATADQVVICNGFSHGFTVLAGVLRTLGHEVVAVEDPGYEGARDVLTALGMRYRPVPVDDDGIDVDALHRSRVRAAVVTPAHQNPTGAVLSSGRRTALLEWARRVDGLVIEDDYDAEYRYDRHPAGAVQGLDPDRVIYCGTTSKSLAPGLRLGWLVVPERLVDQLVKARRPIDSATSSFTQATYAHFLERGDLDRHLRRTRRVYRQRRDAVIDALARWIPDAVPCGASAGLHVLVELPNGIDETALVERALHDGVRVYPLGPFRMHRTTPRTGLVLGYGSLEPAAAERGVRVLAAAADALRPKRRQRG